MISMKMEDESEESVEGKGGEEEKESNSRAYIKMSEDIKIELAFRTIVLGEGTQEVCNELQINYFTAKNMISLYKRTGYFNKPPAHREVGKTESPIGIFINPNGQMSLTFNRILNPPHQFHLLKLHKAFTHSKYY